VGAVTGVRKKPLGQLIYRDRWALAMFLPTLLLLIVFSYLPMYGVLIGFQDYKIGDPILSFGGKTRWVGLSHLVTFVKSIFFTRVFFNTLRLSLLNLLFGFWVPIVFALLLNEIRGSVYKRVSQTFAYLPHFISTVIVVAMLMNLVSEEGPINKLVALLGGESRNLMRLPQYFDVLYVGSHVWQNFGYSSIIYLAAIAGVDPALYEAATIDGANRLDKVWHVTLPTITPTIIVLLILSVGGMLASNTEKVLLMSNPSVANRAEVIGTYIYRVGLEDAKYSYTAAIGLFTNVVNFILVFGANRLSRRFTDYSLW
jgi:putative aldouronate transport system permease protein